MLQPSPPGTSVHGTLQARILEEVTQSCLTLFDPMDSSQPGSSVHGIFPGENTGVGFHFLLQGIFLTRDLNPMSPTCGFFTTEPPGKRLPLNTYSHIWGAGLGWGGGVGVGAQERERLYKKLADRIMGAEWSQDLPAGDQESLRHSFHLCLKAGARGPSPRPPGREQSFSSAFCSSRPFG